MNMTTFDQWYDVAKLRPLTPKESMRAAWNAALILAADIAADHECHTWAECCDCRGKIEDDIIRQSKDGLDKPPCL